MIARILAAFFLAPPFVAVLWYGKWAIAVLFAAISALGAYEMSRIENRDGIGPRLCIVLPWAASLPLAFQWKGVEGAALVLACLSPLLVLPALARGCADKEGRAASSSVAVVFICGFLLGFAVALRAAIEHGEVFVIVLVVLVWVQDTAAYFVGSAIGRHKMTSISPKKSWEGSVAGLLAGVGTACWIAFILLKTLPEPFPLFILGLASAAVAGQLGDLLESLFKREGGVKDSGSLIPGHGGIMDRFDSMCLAAPVLYFWLSVLNVPK